jgi:DNA-binding transcriptional MerR regulator
LTITLRNSLYSAHMSYTVKQLSVLAGVSVRTLHYYDQIGLLKPSSVRENGYRQYQDKEVATLQQILFFRELEFPLVQIKRIITDPAFNELGALQNHKQMLELKRNKIDDLIVTVNKTLQMKKGGETDMTNDDLFDPFKDETYQKYKDEVEQRWGDTVAYKQSMQRVRNMTKQQLAATQQEWQEISEQLASIMEKGPQDPEVQKLIERHYRQMNKFYDCSFEMYKGIGQMYVDDPRFAANYKKQKKGLAVFMRDAMSFYAESRI